MSTVLPPPPRAAQTLCEPAVQTPIRTSLPLEAP